eukprot:GGOE01012794.1.p1 GENE.GGOE01012794.1~~GGOE01012794.1.p1  ORF type:complete len:676 (-),score=173.15 GGOE01012794.1:858-2864(-)
MWAVGRLAVLARPYVVWQPSVHHHHLFRFYRFADPKVEAQYCRRSAHMWRAILRIYCLVVFLFAIPEFFGYLNPIYPDSPFFWTLFSLCTASLLLLLFTCWRGTLPYALPMHALSVCAFAGVYMYHLRVVAVGFNDKAVAYIFANVTSAVDPAVCDRARESVQLLVGQVAQREGLLNCAVLWISLCVAGFNSWTLLAYASLFIASTVGTFANPTISDKATMMFFLVVCTLWSLLISILMERMRRSDFLAQTQLARELQASQLADSVLNHLLKNALADVAANIEIFLAGELGPEVLEDAVVCLQRGIQSCRARMVYLKMVAGDYVPVMNAINLRAFGQQLVAGRNVTTQFLDHTVLMDGTLMQLILENALGNAFKHGHPDHPNVQLVIQQERPQDGYCIPMGRQMMSFTVKNVANPLRPVLTDEMVQKLFRGVARLQPRAVIPTLSDGIGLLHCVLAAQLGGIALSLRQEEDVVTFTATVEADVPDCVAQCSTEDDFICLASQFPAGLKIFCLDDSAASRRLMEFHLKAWCPSAVVRIYGAVEDDVNVFAMEALQEADIVVLDQNLEYSRTHYGTDLCRQLVGHGFHGLVCIRSSDDSQDDQAKYAASGAHCSFGKDLPGAKMIQQMKAAYVLNIARRPLLTDRREYLFHSAPPHSPSFPCPPALVWGD